MDSERIDFSKYYKINSSLEEKSFLENRDEFLKHPDYVKYLFFRGKEEKFSEFRDSFILDKTYDEFTHNTLFKYIYQPMLEEKFSSVCIEGIENLEKNKGYIFVSNHRDIVLDSFLLGCNLVYNGYKFPYPVVGSNLIFSSFANACFSLLHSNIVNRDLQPRELWEQSMLLSSLITTLVGNNISSIWIAGSAGRSKDGIDFVKSSVIKMLYLSKIKDMSIKELLSKFPIVPVSISYEFDPCDILKVHQNLNKNYIRTQKDDILSIEKGLLQKKGKVKINISTPLVEEKCGCDFARISEYIEKEIIKNYELFSVNYLAYDIINSTDKYRDKYFDDDKKFFLKFSHLSPYVKENCILYYANPVISKEKLI